VVGANNDLSVIAGRRHPFLATAPVSAPFPGVIQPGLPAAATAWSGTINYSTPIGPVWQANQARAHLDIDGVAGTANQKAHVTRVIDPACLSFPPTAHLTSSNGALPWDIASPFRTHILRCRWIHDVGRPAREPPDR